MDLRNLELRTSKAFIDWLFYNQEGVSLLRGENWIFTHNSG